jgi:thiopurine S-methyltransferase
MEIDFWQQRWDNDEIGFHQQSINPYLIYFYGKQGPSLEKRNELTVFVPLCGKSKDLLWLSQNNYSVLAVECSELAVRAFFEENALNYKHAKQEQSGFYQSTDLASPIEIVQGDFFALQASDFEQVTDIFDRASLVAMPKDMRQQYAIKMAELQNPGTRTLLVTLSYDQSEMNGPPFSVSEQEVDELYSESFDISKLCFKDIIEDEPGFKDRGLSSMIETVYKLVRK